MTDEGHVVEAAFVEGADTGLEAGLGPACSSLGRPAGRGWRVVAEVTAIADAQWARLPASGNGPGPSSWRAALDPRGGVSRRRGA